MPVRANNGYSNKRINRLGLDYREYFDEAIHVDRYIVFQEIAGIV